MEPAIAAEDAWYAFITANPPNCGEHNIHLVLLSNEPEQAAYAEGVVEYGIVADSTRSEAYLVAKLPGLAFNGVLCERDDQAWRGTELDPVGGFLDASTTAHWPTLMARYFQNRIAAANETTRVEWS
jgi:hypothetical protein